MIIVYSTKSFNKLVRQKLSLKAKRQPRRKDGRFANPAPKPAGIENNPLVMFNYPKRNEPWEHKCHKVRLISATSTHITGLDKTHDGWKYKKFLTSKTEAFRLLEFKPQAMS